jgi:hypothetical protein
MNENESPATAFARGLAAQRRTIAHTCVVCGTPFSGKAHARYCSPACRTRADYARHADQRRASKRQARQVAQQRQATE